MLYDTCILLGSQGMLDDSNKILIIKYCSFAVHPARESMDNWLRLIDLPAAESMTGLPPCQGLALGEATDAWVGVAAAEGVLISDWQVASLSATFCISTGSSGYARRNWVISSSECEQ
jgi:hypothetical protein